MITTLPDFALGGIFTQSGGRVSSTIYSDFSTAFVTNPVDSTEAAITGSFTTETGISVDYDVTTRLILDDELIGVQFAPGSGISVSGNYAAGARFVAWTMSGTASGVYDWFNDNVPIYGRAAEAAFHGYLAPGDSLHYHFIAAWYQFGQPEESHRFQGDIDYGSEGGIFSRTFSVPQHAIEAGPRFAVNPHQTVSLIGELSFEITRRGTETSWIVLDDPDVTSDAPPPETSVPEPATLTLWGLCALGCAVASYRRR